MSSTGRPAGMALGHTRSVTEAATGWWCSPGGMQLLDQRDDFGLVDVVQPDIGAGVEPEDAIIQSAAEVQHHRAVAPCEELARPIVELHMLRTVPAEALRAVTPVLRQS